MSDEQIDFKYVVFGYDLKDVQKNEILEESTVDFIGLYSDFDIARKAWLGASQRTVDTAIRRYFLRRIINV